MINLAAGKCVACRAGEPTLTDAEIEDFLLLVHEWQVKEVEGMKQLERVLKFKNFAQALEFLKCFSLVSSKSRAIIIEFTKVSSSVPVLKGSFFWASFKRVTAAVNSVSLSAHS